MTTDLHNLILDIIAGDMDAHLECIAMAVELRKVVIEAEARKSKPKTTPANIVPVYVAGNNTIHAGRKIGTYPSGMDKYAKLCGSNRRDRHDPSPVGDDRPITCKRCLAKLAA